MLATSNYLKKNLSLYLLFLSRNGLLSDWMLLLCKLMN